MKKYDSYKDSGIEWLGEIPSHWEVKKMKYIFQEKKKVHNKFLNAGSISFGKVVFKDDEKIPESTKASYQEVLKGDYLINPLNLNYDLISLRIALSDIDVVVSSGYIVINNIIEINKEYYRWLLHQYDISYMKLLGSGVRQTINFNHIANSELVFPPLKEQQTIATFLDDKCGQIDTAIAIKEKQIGLLKEQRQIIIHNVVTKGIDKNVKLRDSGVEWIGDIPKHWEVKSFRRVCNLQQGLQISIDKRLEEYVEHSFEYITTKSIHNPENFKHYVLNPSKSVVCDYDDVLMGRTGNTGEVVSDVRGVYHNNFFKINYNKTELLKSFLVVYLKLRGLQNEIMLAAGITTIPDLNHNAFLSLKVLLPSLEEQQQIVNYLEVQTTKIDKAVAIKAQQIEKLKEYKQSLINEVVTGKVRVS